MSSIRRTVRICYLGMLAVALVSNLAPPLFIPLRTAFGLSFEQLGRFILLNCVTQAGCILICGPLVDRLSVRPFVLLANALVFSGVCLFACADRLFPAHPYTGLLLGTVIYGMGGGILDLLLSPIVSAVPSDRKASDMNLLHAFYAIGQILTVALTSLALWLGMGWRIVVLGWSLLPLLAGLGFVTASIPELARGDHRQRLRDIIGNRMFFIAMAAIFLSGASEMAVAQWVSAYAEKGLGLPKLLGDLCGLCLFAAMLGVGRLLIGFHAGHVRLDRVLPRACLLTIAAYGVACLSPWAWLSLVACAVSGLGISPLWPSVLAITAQHFPRGGVSMFAILSACGALGCAGAPWAVGLIADAVTAYSRLPGLLAQAHLTVAPESVALRVGMLAAIVCPVLMLFVIRRMLRRPSAA